jgi:signal transduction histidine kinase
MLYFAGIHGINWFDPAKILPDKKIASLAITSFTVNNLPANTLLSSGYIKSIVLNYQQNNLYLQFHALEFSNPANIHYQYQLKGWDKDWVFSKANNEVRYNYLPPGHYIFYVRASNNDVEWMNEPYSIIIIIEPPFWKTWWFYLIELVAVAAVIIWITKISAQWKLKKEIEKLERQKALYAERMRISQEMHDDIGAGLTQISLISESAKLHSWPENKIENELEDISVTSRQLVDNIGEIIWALNPQHATLDMLMAHIREQLNKLLEYADFKCRIDFPGEIPAILLTNQQRRNILLVTKEIVHNAIKHSGGKKLEVSAVLVNKLLIFDIADDGAGFNTAVVSRGNGLKNIRQRVAEIGGKVSIESAAGKGARFIYSFQLA